MTKPSTLAKEAGFWLAVGLAAVVVSIVLKVVAAKAPLPDGLKELIAAA